MASQEFAFFRSQPGQWEVSQAVGVRIRFLDDEFDQRADLGLFVGAQVRRQLQGRRAITASRKRQHQVRTRAGVRPTLKRRRQEPGGQLGGRDVRSDQADAEVQGRVGGRQLAVGTIRNGGIELLEVNGPLAAFQRAVDDAARRRHHILGNLGRHRVAVLAVVVKQFGYSHDGMPFHDAQPHVPVLRAVQGGLVRANGVAAMPTIKKGGNAGIVRKESWQAQVFDPMDLANPADRIGKCKRAAGQRGVRMRVERRHERFKEDGRAIIVGGGPGEQFAARDLKTIVQRHGQTLVRLVDDSHPRVSNGAEILPRPVGRTVIDDDQFEVGEGLRQHAGDRAGQELCVIEAGQDHRDPRRRDVLTIAKSSQRDLRIARRGVEAAGQPIVRCEMARKLDRRETARVVRILQPANRRRNNESGPGVNMGHQPLPECLFFLRVDVFEHFAEHHGVERRADRQRQFLHGC